MEWKCTDIPRRDLCLETKHVIKDIGKRYVNLEFGYALDFSAGIIYHSEIVLLLLAEAVLFQCHSQSQLLLVLNLNSGNVAYNIPGSIAHEHTPALGSII